MTLRTVGGKGLNLERLRAAGLPVPEFTIIDTSEYDVYVAANDLDTAIPAALTASDTTHTQDPSDTIRDAFRAGTMPPDQRDRILAQLGTLVDATVAVRSSATAEDLPDLSFAGQQDTFLNVTGADAILDAVVECWSSLWTGRAITYRDRNAIDGHLALAVVVQRMVDARSSGVLFTANPLTGHRGQTVIDTITGLGEALVSGQVTPDNLVVDTASGRVLDRTLAGETPAISDAEASELTRLGTRIATSFGEPQDIEWAIDDAGVHILQARAITSLYPLPPHTGPELAAWVSFGASQGMLQPITTLGQDVLLSYLSSAARVFGRRITPDQNQIMKVAGERIWIRLDLALRHPIGRAFAAKLLPNADPATAALVERLASEAAFQTGRPTPKSLQAALAAVRCIGLRVPGALANPAHTISRLDRGIDGLVGDGVRGFEAAATASTPQERLRQRLAQVDAIARAAFPTLLPNFGPFLVPSFAMIVRLRELAERTGRPDADALALSVLRSLPGNVTTTMDLALWRAAERIRSDAPALGAIADTPASELAELYQNGRLPHVAQQAVAEFLERYGMRGVAEIDTGAPRWREQPEAVFEALQSYVQITDPEQAPDRVHAAGVAVAEQAIELLALASRPAEAAQIRFMGSRLRALLGARESPKFALVRLMSELRRALQHSGEELVSAGVLEQPDDVFQLHLSELAVIFDNPDANRWRPLVAQRRDTMARERRRGQVPRLMLSDGRTFYEGLGATDGSIVGQPVSPGVAEGLVRVVADPRGAGLQPGEILVCVGTDPAWTPLFLAAGALVTEVGGLMTHGSVVAREYGIPAVVGVHDATRRLETGQRVRIDGSSGAITLLD